MYKKIQTIVSDTISNRNWGSKTNILKPDGNKTLSLQEVFGKKINSTEKVTEPKDIWGYFGRNTSFHGIKYCLDQQLSKIEHFMWLIIVFWGFTASICIICMLYNRYQARRVDIIVDDLQANLTQVPFPSVTICPISKAKDEYFDKAVNILLPNGNEKSKRTLRKVLYEVSDVYIAKLDLVEFNLESLELNQFNGINLTNAMLLITPKCEEILFNCTWDSEKVDCCEIFDIQKTHYGFCYAFNSKNSVNNSLSEPRKIYSSESMNGLTVIVKSHMLASENKQVNIMIDDPSVIATKGAAISFGLHYDMSVRFYTSYSTPEVLALENISNPPCKYENDNYRWPNCRNELLKHFFLEWCNCTPTLFFNQNPDDPRECQIIDIKCVKEVIRQIVNVTNGFSEITDDSHRCPDSCKFHDYDTYLLDDIAPKDSMSLDIHFDSRTGIRYKRVIVVTDLDMMVQFGGIFGLFVGGSLLTLMEFLYALMKSICSWIYHALKRKFQKKRTVIDRNISIIPYTH